MEDRRPAEWNLSTIVNNLRLAGLTTISPPRASSRETKRVADVPLGYQANGRVTLKVITFNSFCYGLVFEIKTLN